MADKFFIEKKKEKSGRVVAKHNFAWFLGCVVLLLVSITFVLPATGLIGVFSGNEYVFGKFGNKKIIYSQDSYMLRAVENYRKQYSIFSQGSGNDDFINQFAFQMGYFDAVVNVACRYYSNSSGYNVSQDEIDDYVLGLDGFTLEAWDRISSAERKNTISNITDALYASHYLLNLDTNVKDSKNNVEFATNLLPVSKNFSAIVFIGEDASEKSQSALDIIKSGKSIDDCAKEFEKSVVEINNVFEKDFSLVQNVNRSGDVGKFYEALDKDAELKSALFELGKNKLYPEVITVNENEKIIVLAKGDIDEETKNSNKSMIESNLNQDTFQEFRQLVISSPLHKDNFKKTYDKLFSSRGK